jgi:lipooligosaccharide transport system permease protein
MSAPLARAARAPVRHVGRLERAAIAGVMSRELTVFRHYWPSTTFSSIVQPTIYLLAFGLGFGALVSRIGGVSYVQFVGTGTVATAVLFSSAFPGMFGSFVRRKFQRTYDALLAAPVDVEELVTAEVSAIGLKAGLYGVAPLLVAIAFGLDPSWGMLTVPVIGVITGFGFAAFGVMLASMVESIDSFSYVNSAVVTPLFLVAGSFFPIDQLPHWAQVAAWFNPLYSCVELVRHACFGFQSNDLAHLAILLVFGVVMWRLAIRAMGAKVID